MKKKRYIVEYLSLHGDWVPTKDFRWLWQANRLMGRRVVDAG